MNNVVIELNPEEAELFKKFRQYQDIFSIMLNSGIFETPNSVVNMHFNYDCVLTQIDKNVLSYKRIAPTLLIMKN